MNTVHRTSVLQELTLACRLCPHREVVAECGPDCVGAARPTLSGNSNLDCGDVLDLPAAAGQCSSGEEAAAHADCAAPNLPVAESDNEECISYDEPMPKFRRLSCSEPPPAVRVRGWAGAVGCCSCAERCHVPVVLHPPLSQLFSQRAGLPTSNLHNFHSQCFQP